jgi:hypothetical protein
MALPCISLKMAVTSNTHHFQISKEVNISGVKKTQVQGVQGQGFGLHSHKY